MPVIPSSGPVPFASVAEFAIYLQRELTPAEIDAADLLLAIATANIRRAADNQTISLVLGDTHTVRTTAPAIVVPQRPVLTVDAVTLDGNPVTTYTWDGDDTIVGAGRGLVSVTYSHGYEPIPDDVKGLCLDIAARGFLTPHGVNQTSLGSFSESYDRQVAMTLRDEERAKLRPYRRTQHTLLTGR